MTRCLTKLNRKGFTLMEMMVAIAFTVMLMIGVFGFYGTASQDYNSGIFTQNLQDGANIVLSKIIEGETESGTVYRLASSSSYLIPNGTSGALYTCGGTSQASPCNANNAFGEVYFCQDSPCTTADSTVRWYYLNSAGNAVYYHHPSGGGTIEERIYQAPKNATLNLRFSPAAVNTPADALEVDVDLTENLPAMINNKVVTTSGDVSTFCLLRGHP